MDESGVTIYDWRFTIDEFNENSQSEGSSPVENPLPLPYLWE